MAGERVKHQEEIASAKLDLERQLALAEVIHQGIVEKAKADAAKEAIAQIQDDFNEYKRNHPPQCPRCAQFQARIFQLEQQIVQMTSDIEREKGQYREAINNAGQLNSNWLASKKEAECHNANWIAAKKEVDSLKAIMAKDKASHLALSQCLRAKLDEEKAAHLVLSAKAILAWFVSLSYTYNT